MTNRFTVSRTGESGVRWLHFQSQKGNSGSELPAHLRHSLVTATLDPRRQVKGLSKLAFLFVGALLYLAASLAAMAANTREDLASPVFTSSGRFCLGGVIGKLPWEFGEQGESLTVWGSACGEAPSTGRVESTEFLAPANLSMFLAGYVGLPGLRLSLRNLETGGEIELRPQSTPAEHWQRSDFALPADWVGKQVQIVGEQAVVPDGQWFGFTAPRLPYTSVAVGMVPTDHGQSGFCSDRMFPPAPGPGGAPPSGSVIWRSYCELGDNNTGWMASGVFAAGSSLTLYLAGYPSTPGVRLAVENLQTSRQLPLQVINPPRERWQLDTFPLPPQWKGQPVRLLAEDAAARPGGWLAFAEVRPIGLGGELSFAFRLLALTLFLFGVTLLPAGAACVLASARGVKDVLDLNAIALLAMASVGYLAFWIYFISHIAGMVYSYLVLPTCCASIVWFLSRARKRIDWGPLRRVFGPLLLLALASVFIVSIGFVYGKPIAVQDYSAQRFGPPPLSIDNFLPKLLADAVFQRHIPVPFIGDWLSSDRPPLQAGMALWIYPWTHGNRDLPYQVLGVILQLTFIAALWAYLEASAVNRKAMMLVLAATLFSGFTIFNSFFTWPKLFPAALLLIIPGYLFTARYHCARLDWRVGAIVGAAAAFAMLCHGGSAFGLLGLALTLGALRRLPSLRFTLAAIVVAGILHLPWTLYQKYYDPPGDRLLKIHLAGTIGPRPEVGLVQLLAENYGKLSLQELEYNKIENFRRPLDTTPLWSHAAALVQGILTGSEEERSAAVGALRESIFYFWAPSIDLFSLTPVFFMGWIAFSRRKSPELQQAWFLWLFTAITLVVWCLLMFGPWSTKVHHGCYLTELAAMAGGVLALWALSSRLAFCLVAVHIVFNLAVYVFFTPPKPVGLATFMGPLNPVLGVFAGLSGAGFVLVLWRMAHEGAGSGNKATIAYTQARP